MLNKLYLIIIIIILIIIVIKVQYYFKTIEEFTDIVLYGDSDIPSGKYGIKCHKCGNGKQPNNNSTQCENCPLGTAGTNGGCNICTDGQEPNAERTACIECPAGTAGTNGGCNRCTDGQKPNDERTQCYQCPVGTAGTGGFCDTCTSGKYQNNTGQSSCIPCTSTCPNGKYRTLGCSSTNDISCQDHSEDGCPTQHFRAGGNAYWDNQCFRCKTCPTGQYKSGGCSGTSDTACEDSYITIYRNYDNQYNGYSDTETHTTSVPHINRKSGNKGLNDRVSSLIKPRGASVSIHEHDNYRGRCIDVTGQSELNFEGKNWNDEITSIAIPSKCTSSDWWGWW